MKEKYNYVLKKKVIIGFIITEYTIIDDKVKDMHL